MYRLIYKSRSEGKIGWSMVKEILSASEVNNPESNITGVLLATESHFLQVIEGSFDEVNRLFMRIARDLRHDEIQIISFCCVDGRLFGGWAMHGIGIFDFNDGLIKDLISQYGEEEGGVRFPVQDWKVLGLINDLRVL